MDKIHERGCKDPYQYIIHDDGTVTENYFGEIRVLGKVSNPEMLKEVKRDTKPAFSIRSMGSIQEPKRIPAHKIGDILRIMMPGLYHDLYPYQQAMLDLMWEVPSRQLGKDSWFTKLLYAYDENKHREFISHTLKLAEINNINRNGRKYNFEYVKGLKCHSMYYDFEFDPYTKGQPIIYLPNYHQSKLNELLPSFIYEIRYGGLRRDNEIPKVKLNIRRKNYDRPSTNFIKKNSK